MPFVPPGAALAALAALAAVAAVAGDVPGLVWIGREATRGMLQQVFAVGSPFEGGRVGAPNQVRARLVDSPVVVECLMLLLLLLL